MVKFKFDIDYLLYVILLFIIAFLCYKVYTLNEASEIHYLQMCEHEEKNKFNSVSKPTNVILNILFASLAAMCIIPFIFVII